MLGKKKLTTQRKKETKDEWPARKTMMKRANFYKVKERKKWEQKEVLKLKNIKGKTEDNDCKVFMCEAAMWEGVTNESKEKKTER